MLSTYSSPKLSVRGGEDERIAIYYTLSSAFAGGTGAGGACSALASSAFSSADSTYTGGAGGRKRSALCGSRCRRARYNITSTQSTLMMNAEVAARTIRAV